MEPKQAEMSAAVGGRAGRFIPLVLAVLSLAFYAFWSGSGISTLSPTIDEPLHSIGAWHARYAGEFRVDREDPALWLRWVSLFMRESDVAATYDDAAWHESGGGMRGPLNYFARALSPDRPDPLAVIRHGREASLVLAIALGASLAYMAYRLRGPVAAVAAAALFALEPLMLGHGPIVKNDVAITFAFIWAVWLAWRTARGSHLAVPGLVIALATLPLVKFSGPAMAAIAVVPLLFAAWTGRGWACRPVRRPARLTFVATVLLLSTATFFVVVWAAYDFRFLPSRADAVRPPFPDLRPSVFPILSPWDGRGYDWEAQLLGLAHSDLRAQGKVAPNQASLSRAELETWTPPTLVRAALWVNDRHLLPQSYIVGFTYTYGSTLSRRGYLLGEQNVTGWWYYFPFAWAVKSPVATVVLTVVLLAIAARGKRWGAYVWLWLPGFLFALSAIAGHINIGLRHFMPVYPFLILAFSVLVASTWLAWRRWAWCLALAVLAIEVVPHRLEYIQFFNVAVGGTRGGFTLLGDSNLDWGQDVYQLAAWQKSHPDTPVYIDLFSAITDPKAAGLTIQSRAVANGPPGVFAVSATRLQAIYADAATKERMAYWRQQTPAEILGGTIYLFKTDTTP